jgi:hypothetical protein
MFRSDWIILPVFIVAVAVAYGVYSERAAPEAGLRRIEADMKRIFLCGLTDVKYDRTHSHLLVCNPLRWRDRFRLEFAQTLKTRAR